MPRRPPATLLSALVGIGIGAAATLLLSGPPDHRGELSASAAQSDSRLPEHAAAEVDQDIAAARRALARHLRPPAAIAFEDVRVWEYGPADERAVCGTLLPAGDGGGAARFIVRVLRSGDGSGARMRPVQTVIEEAPWLDRPTPEASRRFCHGPPAPTPDPPVQAEVIAADHATGAPSGPLPAETSARPIGRVVTQTAANLRAEPGGPVLATVPRGRSLTVFERAPGGWTRVGEAAPEGWIHASLLSEANESPAGRSP